MAAAAAAALLFIAREPSWDLKRKLAAVGMFAVIGVALAALNASWHRLTSDILRSEERAEQAARHLALALEAGQMGTWEWTPATGKVHWSPGLEAIHGYAPDAFAGTIEAFQAEIHPEDRERLLGEIREVLEGRREHHVLYRIVRADGAVRWVEGRGRLLRDAAGAPTRMIGVCLDVTDRKAAEQERAGALEREREEARRKDAFLAALSHELRGPLAAVRNATHVLGRRFGADLEAGGAQRILARQVGHLVRLVDDLLDVSRIERDVIELRRERVELADVVDAALEAARPALDERRHRVDVSLPEEPVWVDADPVRLSQVVANLLQNSAKFTPSGGSVAVALAREGDGAVVRVSDDGAGFDPADAERLFGLFERGDAGSGAPRTGLGIGLALARRLAELHGGTLAGESAGRGRGSAFTLRVPAAAPPEARLKERRELLA